MSEISENSQIARVENAIVGIQEQGGVVVNEGVDFRQTSDAGVGIYSNRELQKGEVLIRVPFTTTISVEAVTSYEPLKAIFTENEGLLQYPDEVLAVGLMYAQLRLQEGDVMCPWSLHVSTMPTAFNTPIYWDDHEVDQLKGTNVYHLTSMLKRQIMGDYNSIYTGLLQAYPELLGGISIHLYTWALSVIYSRALDITRKETHTRVIVPLLDMCNHSYTAEHAPDAVLAATDTFHFDEETDSVCLLAGSTLPENSEVHAVYGDYCNAKLLYTYGFVLRENPHQRIDVWTKLMPSAAFAPIKQRLLQQHGLDTSAHTYDFAGTIRNRPVHVTSSLLNMIRIIQCDSDVELQRVPLLFKGEMITPRNEMAAYASLRGLLTARLGAEQAQAERKELGEMLLSDVPAHDRKLMALMVKVQERELVQEAISTVDEWVAQLAKLGPAFKPMDLQAAKV